MGKKSNKGQEKFFLPFYKFMMGVGLVFNFVWALSQIHGLRNTQTPPLLKTIKFAMHGLCLISKFMTNSNLNEEI